MKATLKLMMKGVMISDEECQQNIDQAFDIVFDEIIKKEMQDESKYTQKTR